MAKRPSTEEPIVPVVHREIVAPQPPGHDSEGQTTHADSKVLTQVTNLITALIDRNDVRFRMHLGKHYWARAGVITNRLREMNREIDALGGKIRRETIRDELSALNRALQFINRSFLIRLLPSDRQYYVLRIPAGWTPLAGDPVNTDSAPPPDTALTSLKRIEETLLGVMRDLVPLAKSARAQVHREEGEILLTGGSATDMLGTNQIDALVERIEAQVNAGKTGPPIPNDARDLSKSIEYINSLRTKLLRGRHVIDLLLQQPIRELAVLLYRQGNVKDALDRVQDILSSNPKDLLMRRIKIRAELMREGDGRSLLSDIQQWKSEATNESDLIKFQILEGVVHRRQSGDADLLQAQQRYLQGYETASRLGLPELAFRASLNLAENAHWLANGEPTRWFAVAQECLGSMESLKDPLQPSYSHRLANMRHLQGIRCFHLREYKKAITLFSTAQATYETAGLKQSLVRLLSRKANAFHHLKDLASAKSHYELARTLANDVDPSGTWRGIENIHLALVALEEGDLQAAESLSASSYSTFNVASGQAKGGKSPTAKISTVGFAYATLVRCVVLALLRRQEDAEEGVAHLIEYFRNDEPTQEFLSNMIEALASAHGPSKAWWPGNRWKPLRWRPIEVWLDGLPW